MPNRCVLVWLAALDEDRVFENVQEVWDVLGGGHESRTAAAAAVPAADVPAPRSEPRAPTGAATDDERTTRGVCASAGQPLDVTLRVVAIPVGVTLAAVRVAVRVLRRSPCGSGALDREMIGEAGDLEQPCDRFAR